MPWRRPCERFKPSTAKLAAIKHCTYMDKREGQFARRAVRIDLLLHRANEFSAPTTADLTQPHDGFKAEVHKAEAKYRVATQAVRAAAKP